MKELKEKNRPYDLSVIVPVFNEVDNIGPLCEEICQVLDPLRKTYEILLVDDGSSDGTVSAIQKICQRFPAIKAIFFSRNYGQTAAMAAGFKYAQGDVYITLDADGQNDPAGIPLLLEKLTENYDIVSGWREARHDRWLTRKLPSQIANKLISKITGVRLKDYGCSLKAYRSAFMDPIHLYGEMHRFIPALAQMTGAKIAEVSVPHRPRLRGTSKYGLSRVFKVLMDLMTVKFLNSYSTKPNYLFGGLGSLFCLGGVLCGGIVLVQKFCFGAFAHRNPVLLLAVFLFILGVLFFMMGLLAELMVRTYYEAQNKEIYYVKQLVNFKIH